MLGVTSVLQVEHGHVHWCRYTTDASYKEFEQMRTSMEPLTYKHGVDVFFYGRQLPISSALAAYQFFSCCLSALLLLPICSALAAYQLCHCCLSALPYFALA